MTRSVQPVDRAADFKLPELFFSITDREGRIKACNDVFLRIAGYSSEEMLGAPHNIIRHPDMPKCVFQLLWDYLLADRPVGAYVKNLTSEGEYYWVYALVFPIDEGFLSIRLKPSSAIVATVQQVYAGLLATEATHGARAKEGIRAATAELGATLDSIGHETYDSFMVHGLREEIGSRNQGLCARSQSAIASIFDELAPLDTLQREATEQATQLATVSRALNRIALNASVCAARMDERGQALAVLSEHASRISADISTEVELLDTAGQALASTLQETSFQVSFATLVMEMTSSFRQQAEACGLSAEQQIQMYGGTCSALSDILDKALGQSLDAVRQGVTRLRKTLDSFDHTTESFARLLLTTRINHVTGRSIVASLPDGEQYSNLLDEMATIAESARTKLEPLQTITARVDRMLGRWLRDSLAA